MTVKERAAHIVRLLKTEYPIPECTLDHDAAWQLLFNARLAAQCTDKRVNLVTPALFKAYPTAEEISMCPLYQQALFQRPARGMCLVVWRFHLQVRDCP